MGFGFSLAPLAGNVGGSTELGKEKAGKRKRFLKTEVAPWRITTLTASLCLELFASHLGLTVKLVGGTSEWDSPRSGHRDLGQGQVSFRGPSFFQKPSGLPGRGLGTLGALGVAGWRDDQVSGQQPSLQRYAQIQPPMAQLKVGV